VFIIPNISVIRRDFLNFAVIRQDVLSLFCLRQRRLKGGKSGQQRAPDFREEDIREGMDYGEENNRPGFRGKGEKVR